MSRDQKPRRSVMVDSAPDPADPALAAGADADNLALKIPATSKSSPVLPSLLFLLACIAGAVGVAILPIGGM